jgi:hypothetical protein
MAAPVHAVSTNPSTGQVMPVRDIDAARIADDRTSLRRTSRLGVYTTSWYNSVGSPPTQRSRSAKHQGLIYEHTDRPH